VQEGYSGGNYIDAASDRREGFARQRAVRSELQSSIMAYMKRHRRVLAGLTVPTDAADALGRFVAPYVYDVTVAFGAW
jgi:hypothetical protein